MNAIEEIINTFARVEALNLTADEFMNEFNDINEFPISSALPETYNAIKSVLQKVGLNTDRFIGFIPRHFVVALSESYFWSHYNISPKMSLEDAIECYTNYVVAVQKGECYHCAIWQLNVSDREVSLKVIGEHSKWEPIANSIAKVKKKFRRHSFGKATIPR